MTDAVMALNAGSSSFKFAISAMDDVATRLISGTVERIGAGNSVLTLKGRDGAKVSREIGDVDHRDALRTLFAEVRTAEPALQMRGIGHRIVHGGNTFADPVEITPDIISEIEALVPLAPLHQPHGLQGVVTSMSEYPSAKHVACFDTAFHARKPWVNNAYALPQRYYDEGVRGYGFHGLACESICAALREDGFLLDQRKIAIAHLGNGCSVTAVSEGAPTATSMGFSTLDGLTMGTRTGRIDPGVLLHLMRSGLDADALEKLLYHEAGLLGLSGVSNDMRDLMDSEDPACAQAIAFFIARLVEEIARMAAAMGGLDTVVFSGGIGENSTAIRDAVAARLTFLPGRSGEGVAYIVKPADEEHRLMSAAAEMAAQ